jgi:hypothetical protein
MIMPGLEAMEVTSCETRARNLSPEVVGRLDEALFPHETNIRQAANRIRETKTALFKRRTPKSMMEKDLDAKPRIIAELIGSHPGS